MRGALALLLVLGGCGTTPVGGPSTDGGVPDAGARDGGAIDGGLVADGGEDAGAADGGVRVCGTRGGSVCGPDEFCDFFFACGADDRGGVCRKRPTICPRDCPGVCGCDGRFYCNVCVANSAGVDDSSDRSCLPDAGRSDGGRPGGGRRDGGAVCGGIAGSTCAENEWCDFDAAHGAPACGTADAQGICRPRPEVCPLDCPGACGCDGRFYCNACEAHAAGTDDTGDSRPCLEDAGTGGICTSDASCPPGYKCCYPCGIPGCPFRCVAVGDGGMCPLVP